MRETTRVYIAGPLTPKGLWNKNLAVDYLLNVRNMIEAGKSCLLNGLTPFVPAFDFNFFIALRNGEEITETLIKKYSIDWLLVCDAVLLVPGWEESSGTLAEMEIANKKGIPVFESIENLLKWTNSH